MMTTLTKTNSHTIFLVTINDGDTVVAEADTLHAARKAAKCRTEPDVEIYSQQINHCKCGEYRLVAGVETDVDGNASSGITNVCANCGITCTGGVPCPRSTCSTWNRSTRKK